MAWKGRPSAVPSKSPGAAPVLRQGSHLKCPVLYCARATKQQGMEKHEVQGLNALLRRNNCCTRSVFTCNIYPSFCN
jgi:hypothetical protein